MVADAAARRTGARCQAAHPSIFHWIPWPAWLGLDALRLRRASLDQIWCRSNCHRVRAGPHNDHLPERHSFIVLRPLRALLKSWRVRPMAAATAGAEFALGTRELAALSSPCGWRLIAPHAVVQNV